MVTIHGKLFDGKTSAPKAVVLSFKGDGDLHVVEAGNGESLSRQDALNVKCSDRLADTPRFITLADGSIVETDDNDAVDQVLSLLNKNHWSQWVHLLESRKKYVLAAFVGMILIGVAMVQYGFPAAAKVITTLLPRSFFELADTQTLKVLDKALVRPSELAEGTEQRIRNHFESILAEHESSHLQMLFRKGGRLGPNAFALPGGTILFTDELIEMAKHDDELLAIMAHEVGHVVHQHGMRRMVQDSLLSFAILALTGDASGVSEIFLGLPVILTELAYSREFEREADQYALEYLQARDIPPKRFADILTRIDRRVKEHNVDKETAEADDMKNNKDDKAENLDRDQEGSWTGYLSTHPPTPERVKVFLETQMPTPGGRL